MKQILSLSAVATLAVMFSVSQTGCTGGYVVTSDPGPAYSPYVPLLGWLLRRRRILSRRLLWEYRLLPKSVWGFSLLA